MAAICGFRFANGDIFNGEVSWDDYRQLDSQHGNFYAMGIAGEAASRYGLDLTNSGGLREYLKGGYPGCTTGVLYEVDEPTNEPTVSLPDLDNQPEQLSIQTQLINSQQEPAAQSRPGREAVSWSHAATSLLISLYADHRELFASSTMRKLQVWQKISQALTEKGHTLTADQCDKKWRALRYRYLQIVEGNSRTGTGRRRWEWFDLLDDILAGDPAAQPQTTISSQTGVVKACVSGQTCTTTPVSATETSHSGRSTPSTVSETSGRSTPTPTVNSVNRTTPTTSKKRKREGEAPEWVLSFQQETRETSQKFLEVSRERNAILQQIADALLHK